MRWRPLAVCAGLVLLSLWQHPEPVTVSVSEMQTRELPVLMYHSILQDEEQQGDYVVSPRVLENDIQYLQKHHYQTVTVSEVIAYVDGSGELPQKPVMITFDDGYYNNYKYAYPILKKYGARAVLSPVAALSEQFTESGETNAYWSYCTRRQLKEMSDSGIFELANHSYDMHELSPRKGCLKRTGETGAQYREALTNDIKRAQEVFGKYEIPVPVCYTYPYGALSDQTEEIVREMGFLASLGCEEGINTLIRGDNSCLYRLKRYNRASGKSSAQFLSEILTGMLK